MEDKGQEPEQVQDAPEATPEQESDSKTFSIDYVKELREEAAARRVERNAAREESKKLQDQLDKLLAAQKKAEDSKLAEQQQWQELAVKREQELEEMRQQLKTAALVATRADIASRYGLNVDLGDGVRLSEYLRGDTADEMEEHAKRLSKLVQQATQTEPEPEPEKTPAARRQNTSASPGGTPVGTTEADRRARYYTTPGNSPVFQGGEIKKIVTVEE